jgi:hypothetical protein
LHGRSRLKPPGSLSFVSYPYGSPAALTGPDTPGSLLLSTRISYILSLCLKVGRSPLTESGAVYCVVCLFVCLFVLFCSETKSMQNTEDAVLYKNKKRIKKKIVI